MAGYETNNGHTTQTKVQADGSSSSAHTAPLPAHTASGMQYTISSEDAGDEGKVQDPEGFSGSPPCDNTPSDSRRERSSDEKGGKEFKRKEEELGLEYRLSTSLLPLRCYLDSHFIYFLQDLNSRQQAIQEARRVQNGDSDSSSSPSKPREKRERDREREREKAKGGKADSKDDSSERERDRDGSQGPYFQHVWIAPMMLKIDYEPGTAPPSTFPSTLLR
jgi:hypothetical protein